MEIISRIAQNKSSEIQHVLLEDPIYKPEATLNGLCEFKFRKPSENYIKACKERLSLNQKKQGRIIYEPSLVNFVSENQKIRIFKEIS